MNAERFPHCLVIEGDKGLGKKTLARKIATALVCRGEEKPCMSCSQCRKAQAGIHPDIIENTASGAANSFHVDTVRKIIGDVYLKPNEARFKVYILGNADCMNASAQNALLKILEEPPQYAVFILTTKSKGALLETVLSRSVVLSLEGVDASRGAEYIHSHMSDAPDYEFIKSVLESFGGNIGKATESLTRGNAGEVSELCRDICLALSDGSEYDLLKVCSAFQKEKMLIADSMDYLKNIFRDAIFYGENTALLSGDGELARKLKKCLSREKLVDLISVCDKLKEMALMNSNNSLLITKICYSLREASGR